MNFMGHNSLFGDVFRMSSEVSKEKTITLKKLEDIAKKSLPKIKKYGNKKNTFFYKKNMVMFQNVLNEFMVTKTRFLGTQNGNHSYQMTR